MKGDCDLFTIDWLEEFEGWERVETVNMYTELRKCEKYKMLVRDNDFPILVTIYLLSDNTLIFRGYPLTRKGYKKKIKCLLK